MFKRLSVFIFALFISINLCGCALMLGAAAGGAGTAVWLSGKLSDEIEASYERTIEATKSALGSMDMPVTKETKKDDITQIMSKYIDGTTVWIDIRPVSQSDTKVEVRVGATGNKKASAEIIDAIKKHL